MNWLLSGEGDPTQFWTQSRLYPMRLTVHRSQIVRPGFSHILMLWIGLQPLFQRWLQKVNFNPAMTKIWAMHHFDPQMWCVCPAKPGHRSCWGSEPANGNVIRSLHPLAHSCLSNLFNKGGCWMSSATSTFWFSSVLPLIITNLLWHGFYILAWVQTWGSTGEASLPAFTSQLCL